MCVRKIYSALLALVILFLSLPSLAQYKDSLVTEEEVAFFQRQIDSFPLKIATGKILINNFSCLLPRHINYRPYFPDNSISYPKAAFELKEKDKPSYFRMYALMSRGVNYYNNKNFKKAEFYWQQALEIAIKNDFDFEELHVLRPSLNNNYFLEGQFEEAMKISTEGLKRAENINDLKRVVHFNAAIGSIHIKLRNFNRAEQYFLGNLQLSRNIKDSLTEGNTLCDLADLAFARQDYEKAISLLQQSGKLFSAVKLANLFTPKEREIYISNKIADAYKRKQDYRKALSYAITSVNSIAAYKDRINAYDIASYYINTGDIYNHLQKPDSAIFYLQTGLDIAHQIQHREYMRDAYEQLASAFAQKKKFDSAYNYQSLFSNLKDSIVAESNQREILQAESAVQIERQKRIQQMELEQQKKEKNIIIGIAIFLFLTLIYLYNQYRLRQKNKYQKELNRHRNELFNAIAVAQDQERKRIAQDIHDSLGSVLSAARLKLSSLRDNQQDLSDEQNEKYLVTIQLIDEASAELRSISQNIMPATLSKLGLLAALQNLINTISSNSGLQINFSAHDFEERLDEHVEISIYRIILELINNIVKHAAAEKATVQLIRYPDHLNITIEDNGKGFDYAQSLQGKKGIGLGNIISRVEYLNGTMDVDTLLGRGTTVIIDVPL